MVIVVPHGKHCEYATSLKVLTGMLMVLERRKFQTDLLFMVLFLDCGSFLCSLCLLQFYFYLSFYLSVNSCLTVLSRIDYICFSFHYLRKAVRLIYTSRSTMMIPHFYNPPFTYKNPRVANMYSSLLLRINPYFSLRSQTLPVSNNCTKAQNLELIC